MRSTRWSLSFLVCAARGDLCKPVLPTSRLDVSNLAEMKSCSSAVSAGRFQAERRAMPAQPPVSPCIDRWLAGADPGDPFLHRTGTARIGPNVDDRFLSAARLTLVQSMMANVISS